MLHLHPIRRAAVACASASVCLALTALPASATYYKTADLGKFRIVSGRFDQSVQYLADSTAASGAFAGTNCYLYHYTDKGQASFKLTAVPGDEIPAKLLLGNELDFSGVHWSGTTSRQWSGQEKTSNGPSYEDDGSCGNPLPGIKTSHGCGTKHVRDVTGIEFSTYREGKLQFSATDGIGPYGAILAKDPLSGCSSDSTYGTEPLAAPSRYSPKRLSELSVGDTVKLSGTATDSTLSSIIWDGEQGHQGSVRAELTWDLVVEKVSRK